MVTSPFSFHSLTHDLLSNNKKNYMKIINKNYKTLMELLKKVIKLVWINFIYFKVFNLCGVLISYSNNLRNFLFTIERG